MRINARRKIYVISAVFISVSAVFVLSACNNGAENTSGGDYALYIADISYDAGTGTMTAYVKTSGAEKNKLEGVKTTFSGRVVDGGFWYANVISEYGLNPDAIYRAVERAIPQDERNVDGVEYSVLKVAFRYDTIYKSAVSNGERVKVSNKYRHTMALNENAETASFVSSRKTQNSANWYSVLLSCGIVTVVAAVAATLIIERKKCRKK